MVFESLEKIIRQFQGPESLWKMNDSTQVFESLRILTSLPN